MHVGDAHPLLPTVGTSISSVSRFPRYTVVLLLGPILTRKT
jgi:hypothetical protein